MVQASEGGGAVSEAPDEEVRVLFIEDDPAVAEMYKLKLELDGYTVTVAKDGEEGLQLANETPPDIIFLDTRLPKMDGFAVLEHAGRDKAHVHVVFVTAYDDFGVAGFSSSETACPAASNSTTPYRSGSRTR